MPKRTIQVQQEFVSSAARTSDGLSNPLKCEHAEMVTFGFLVTAASGTNPGLGFAIQWSFDNTNWFTTHEIVRTGVTGILHKTIPVVARYFRIKWEITGTSPSFTFKVDSAWRE